MEVPLCLFGVAVVSFLQRYPRYLSVADPILLGFPRMTSDRSICRLFRGEKQDAKQVVVGSIPRH